MATKRSAATRGARAARKPVAKATPARRSAAAAKAKAKPGPARRKAAPIPKGFRSLTPYLVVRGARDAIAFYAKAFGARQKSCLAMPDGSVMHAELQIGDSMLMLSEENPAWGSKSPLLLGGSGAHVMIYTRAVDAFMARAVAAGAVVVMPATDMFWGDRYGKLRDPFGHEWSVGTHQEDVSAREMQRRSDEWLRQQMAGGPPTA